MDEQYIMKATHMRHRAPQAKAIWEQRLANPQKRNDFVVITGQKAILFSSFTWKPWRTQRLGDSLLAHPLPFAEPISFPPSCSGMPPFLHFYDNPPLLCDPNRPPFAQSTLLLLVIFKFWDAVVAHVDMVSVTSTWCRVRCSCFVALSNVTRCLPRRLPNGYPSF